MPVCKTDSQWELAVGHRQLQHSALCQARGWDGVGGEREGQEQQDMHMPVADSC